MLLRLDMDVMEGNVHHAILLDPSVDDLQMMASRAGLFALRSIDDVQY
jgi:hypothetical protein